MSREETKQILSELHEVSGVSGREYKVGEKMKELLSGCYDELTVDALGNYIFKKKGITGKKKIMLSAHMMKSDLLFQTYGIMDMFLFYRLECISHV